MPLLQYKNQDPVVVPAPTGTMAERWVGARLAEQNPALKAERGLPPGLGGYVSGSGETTYRAIGTGGIQAARAKMLSDQQAAADARHNTVLDGLRQVIQNVFGQIGGALQGISPKQEVPQPRTVMEAKATNAPVNTGAFAGSVGSTNAPVAAPVVVAAPSGAIADRWR